MKTKIILLAFASLLSSIHIWAQSSPLISSETRTSKPYHFILIKGEMNVKIVQDREPGVKVEGTSYQLDNTITMLQNDTLFVFQTNTRKRDNKTRLVINVSDITLLAVSGKTKVDCSGLIHADYLTIRAKDGARIKLNVRAQKPEKEVTGYLY